ncbi:MAG: hypothetical protein LBH16_10625 [Treponema sp.]|jgi:hypothetical protein|nr:hypothetical protein [Treponema sp.]
MNTYNVVVKWHKYTVEEADGDINYYKEVWNCVAACPELQLSAEDKNLESKALEGLKVKISETNNIKIEDIEFQVTKEDDDDGSDW